MTIDEAIEIISDELHRSMLTQQRLDVNGHTERATKFFHRNEGLRFALQILNRNETED